MADYILEAKRAMDKAADYGNQAQPVAMVTQAHFASAVAFVAIAQSMAAVVKKLEKIVELLEGGGA